MPSNLSTLHELAVKYAQKQPGIVDDLTEDAPILALVKWKEANHKLWHVAEKLTDIHGPAFVKFDAPLPMMNASTDLVTTELSKMGGTMEVATDRAMKMGGPMKYFADKQPYILKRFGMDTERQIILENWLKAAIAVGGRNKVPAGGTGYGWFILAVRFDGETNCGLYDPDQFAQGRLLNISFPYAGNEHYLKGNGYEGVLGYSVVYRGHFGYQILLPSKTVAAIVNIDDNNLPTPVMIDDLLSAVRAQLGNTYLFMSPICKSHAINNYKLNKVELTNSDKDARTVIDTWNGIPIVTSYNIEDQIPYIA